MHSRLQGPRSFWSVPRIASSWKVQRRVFAIHRLPVIPRMLRVKSDKSVWLRIRNYYSAHARKIEPSQRSRLTNRSAVLIECSTCELYNNYSMSPSRIWSDQIANERVVRVGYNHFISNKGEWNNCFSKFSNRVLPSIFISTGKRKLGALFSMT